MHWIYLSPHLDDAALSLGGLLWEQTAAGESASIWTICAGDIPPGHLSPFAVSLHERWGVGRDAIAARRAEDAVSCSYLGSSYRHFSIPDCIYRRSEQTGDHLYASESALFGALHPDEQDRVGRLSQTLKAALTPGVNLVCPLSLGDHVDHQLTRAAAERLNIRLQYYADYPYVVEIPDCIPENLEPIVYQISAEGLRAWQDSIAAHRSQISTFWKDTAEMQAAIFDYTHQTGGIILWQRLERMF